MRKILILIFVLALQSILNIDSQYEIIFSIVFCGLLLLLYLHGNSNFTGQIVIVLVAYFSRIIIGLLHHYIVFGVGLFELSEFIPLTEEYQATYDFLMNAIDYKEENSWWLWYIEIFGVNHQLMWNIIAVLVSFIGKSYVNIIALNSLFAVLMATELSLLVDIFRRRIVLKILLLMPFGMITTLFWRDLIAVSLMFIVLARVLKIRNNSLRIVLFFFPIVISSLHREIYGVLLLIAALYKSQNNVNGNRVLRIFIALVVLSFLIPFATHIPNMSDLLQRLSTTVVYFPIKFIYGLIGPFPWTQFAASKVNSYQYQDYLQAVFNCTVFLLVFLRKNRIKKDVHTYFGLMLIFSGILNPYQHMSYIAPGFILLSVSVLPHTTLKEFFGLSLVLFVFFIASSVVYDSIGYGVGLMEIFRGK